ncbi:hypothetical protein KM043_001997 [Ampulex compressa]|nr:hypothetical protein KM043_001997 [Ampulex compressa]
MHDDEIGVTTSGFFHAIRRTRYCWENRFRGRWYDLPCTEESPSWIGPRSTGKKNRLSRWSNGVPISCLAEHSVSYRIRYARRGNACVLKHLVPNARTSYELRKSIVEKPEGRSRNPTKSANAIVAAT